MFFLGQEKQYQLDSVSGGDKHEGELVPDRILLVLTSLMRSDIQRYLIWFPIKVEKFINFPTPIQRMATIKEDAF